MKLNELFEDTTGLTDWSGHLSLKISDALYKNEFEPEISRDNSHLAAIKKLDAVFKEAPPHKHLTLWHGLRRTEKPGEIFKGSTITIPSFISSSENVNVAKGFAGRNTYYDDRMTDDDIRKYLFLAKIELSPKVKAIYVRDFVKGQEDEWLINRGTTFKIGKIDVDNKNHLVIWNLEA